MRRQSRPIQRSYGVPIVALGLLVLAGLPGLAAANDVWLEPRTFVATADETLSVFQRHGRPFAEERVVPIRKTIASRLDLIRPDTTLALLSSALDGKTFQLEAGRVPHGSALLVMDHVMRTATMRGDLFGRMLNLEELRDMRAERQSAMPKNIERERYSRFMKSLVQIGPDRDEQAALHVTGQTLEIVPLSDPRRIALGDTLDVRVLYRGKPQSNALVWAYAGSSRNKKVLAKRRTNDEGIARLPVRRKGRWIMRVVHMEVCRACTDADWQSYWASYSFLNE